MTEPTYVSDARETAATSAIVIQAFLKDRPTDGWLWEAWKFRLTRYAELTEEEGA